MVSAPHLPPKSCNIKMHERLLAMPSFLFLVGISILSGIAAALVTIAWIAPPLYTDQGISLVDSGRNGGSSSLNPSVAANVRQRLIAVFDISKKVGSGVYPEAAFVMHAALLSSDGWAVMALSDYRPGKEKQWEGIDAQGVPHRVDRVVVDSVAGLVYVKFVGDGFRVFSFPNWQSLGQGTTFWYADNGRASLRDDYWKSATLGSRVRVGDDASYPAWLPEYRHRLDPVVPTASLLFGEQGELVGFADADNRFIPGWLIAGSLSSVLSSRPIRYDTLSWEGTMVEGVNSAQGVKFLSGFFITKTGANSLGIQRNDLIIRIGGESVDPTSFARQILFTPQEFPVTVLRSGEEIELLIRKPPPS